MSLWKRKEDEIHEKLTALYQQGYQAGLKRAQGVARAAQFSKTPATDTMHGIQKLIDAACQPSTNTNPAC